MAKEKILIQKYASKYFHMTAKTLEKQKNLSVLKFFCFSNNISVCGIKFVQKIMLESIEVNRLDNIKVFSLLDGEIANAFEPVIIIEANYSDIALLEGVIDGFLTRLSSITTNVKKIMKLISNKEIIFMADRNDLYINQPYDGYAAYLGGIRKFVTQAMMENIDDKNIQYVGTIPHSLIQQHQGNLVQALKSFHKTFPDVKITALIDYQNDCLSEIEKISQDSIKNHIEAVRIDTSSALVDKSLQIGNWENKPEIKGVCHKLISNVRKALDNKNLNNVKIIVSSSINETKIKDFEERKTPVDIYGIGSWFLTKSCHFTADLVKINQKYEAKIGRNNFDKDKLDRLKLWDWKMIRENKC